MAESFSKNWAYLATCLGMAIGLGSLWKAPSLFYSNGGGAFLIPFLVALVVMGIPVFMLETALGVKMRSSFPMALKKLHPKAEMIGWYSCAGGLVVTAYYAIIIGYCLDYIVEAARMAWGIDPGTYFNNDVLRITSDIFIFGGLAPKVAIAGILIYVGCGFIISRGLQGGLEKANQIFIPGLLLMSIGIVIRAVTLPGAYDGLVAYVTPDFSALWRPEVWVMAFTLVTFLTSVGMGLATTFGSYLPAGSKIVKNSLIVCLGVAGYALMMGAASFSIIGYLAHTTGKPLSEVVAGGFKLAFTVYPTAANEMPYLRELFGIAFFACAVFAGVSSALAFYEAVPAALSEKFKITKTKGATIAVALTLIGGIIFMTGAGLMWIDIVDRYVCTWVMLATVMLEIPIIIKYMGLDTVREVLGVGKWFNYVIPVSMASILFLLIMDAKSLMAGLYGGYPLMAQILAIGYIGVFVFLGYLAYKAKPR